MWKEKLFIIRDFLIKHSKIAFPIIVVAAVAVTVTLALNAGSNQKIVEEEPSTEVSQESSEVAIEAVEKDVPLVLNEDGNIRTLIYTLYNALALGDSETLTSLFDEISDKDMIFYLENAKYIEKYPDIEIYTKPGYEEGSTIAYVYYHINFINHEESVPGYKAHYICTNDQGELYIKNSANSPEVEEYIKTVSTQADLVEFDNRISVEYQELIDSHPELKEYLTALGQQVNTAVGVTLAQLNAETEENEQNGQESQNIENVAEGTPGADNGAAEGTSGVGDGTSEGNGEGGESGGQPAEQEPVENTTKYATATTTVNVRESDSEQADKLGKVAEGTKLQVLEQRVNGWTQVLYEGKQGYIKSDYLSMVESGESAAGAETIGTVTATMNVNVRASASESGEKLGVLVGGDSAELIAKENDWCKIKYNGKIGYVKAEYVQ